MFFNPVIPFVTLNCETFTFALLPYFSWLLARNITDMVAQTFGR